MGLSTCRKGGTTLPSTICISADICYNLANREFLSSGSQFSFEGRIWKKKKFEVFAQIKKKTKKQRFPPPPHNISLMEYENRGSSRQFITEET